MFDYDAWLESPYTSQEDGCEEDCPVCWTACESCDGAGRIPATFLIGERDCEDCSGNGGSFEQQSRQEHKDYYADDRDDD
jgi:hypothetical protein